MSTAVASAAAAPLSSPHTTRDPSPKNCPTLIPPPAVNSSPPRPTASRDAPQGTPENKAPSPSQGSAGPKITVKKEPASPPRMSRPRPRKLDLSTSLPTSSGLTVRPPGGPMTARDVSMQDVGLACLSPGFQTHDPVMREQLQRSLSVRDQQRSIIESRLQRSAKDDGPDGIRPSMVGFMGMPPTGSSKRRPPPGLSIVPPSASQFANERVIQSAPLNQSFTGRYQPQPLTRHVVNQSPTLGSTSHMHQIPAPQTNNRLPPLSDVFGSDALGARDREPVRQTLYVNASSSNSSQSNLAPMPSPGLPPNTSQTPTRLREYRSAEEAVQELSGGREDLLPRIVHYGGHQPPTPPSPQTLYAAPKTAPLVSEPGPMVPPAPTFPPADITARRRPRSEYENDNGSPPLGHGPDSHFRPNPATMPGPNATFHGPFGAGRDSPETQRKKKEEFLGLCSRAWDLFHS
ncbi:uncharacterized protein N7483_012303 [Penicillium malachiteum]|uniref:uncharacterized protein n=1 Tax=Penicillium malachiteum TaxID=1324776 RepID=UPI002546EB32|nr:uncharacterized protein N7483_012303 [Penicillium malachiteum]KAJ5715122.1 hypothetical protein N7483_012303 [Penicillium malachiteum]